MIRNRIFNAEKPTQENQVRRVIRETFTEKHFKDISNHIHPQTGHNQCSFIMQIHFCG